MVDQAVIVQVADGISAELASALDAGVFEGLLFKPKRGYADWKDEELGDLKCLNVDVVPVIHAKSEHDDRGSTLYACEVDIAVRQKFDGDDLTSRGRVQTEKVDRLIRFIEEIHEHFCDQTSLPTVADASWVDTKIRMTYSRKHLREMKLFFGVVRVTYETAVEL